VEDEIDERIERTVSEVESIVESGGLSGALREICDLANFGNGYFQDRKPWETEDKAVILSSLKVAKAISIMLEPFVPSFSEEVYEIFSLDRPGWDDIYRNPSGKLTKPRPLLEKQDIEDLKSQYEEKVANKTKKTEGKPDMSKEAISFDDFNALDMRVGRIVKVDEMPSADRLYKIQVDVGYDELQTISGLKKHYEPGDLEGKQVIVLTNLEPATIHGEKSECMLLAAEGEELALLGPDKDIEPGAEVA
jgi:methionyl-tRNA synthetase